MHWLEHAPIWLIGVVLFATLMAAHELGFRAARAAFADTNGAQGIGTTVASVMALLSLMLAFTFGAAQDRYNTRRELLVDEANAIGTAYLRIQLLEQPMRGVLGGQMLPYAQARAEFQQATADPKRLELNRERTELGQRAIWTSVKVAVRDNPTPTLNSPVLQAVNDMFDAASKRRAANNARVPGAILIMLLLYATVAAVLIGVSGGPRRRFVYISGAQLVLLTLAYCLILTLDRPSASRVAIDEAPMLRVAADIRQDEAAGPDPPPAR